MRQDQNPDIEAIRARARAATPGPWQWFGNTKTFSVYLATVYGGRRHVMNFWRWGMSGAQPAFQVSIGPPVEPGDGFMMKLSEMANECPDIGPRFEVAHRRDFFGISHPDAAFIASARQDMEVLLSAYDQVVAERDAALSELSAMGNQGL